MGLLNRPLARGDGPTDALWKMFTRASSPRTRGRTDQPERGGLPPRIVPSHGGMDRCSPPGRNG